MYGLQSERIGTMIDEITKDNANRLGNAGDTTGNVLVTLIGAVDALEERVELAYSTILEQTKYIENIKQCTCEESKKVSAPVTKTTKRSK
jgi:hypothetical protein